MEKTRQELFELVWSMPMTKLSKQFELSDVGLRKICIKNQIPLPPQGHWIRKQFGKEAPRPELIDKDYNPIIEINDDYKIQLNRERSEVKKAAIKIALNPPTSQRRTPEQLKHDRCITAFNEIKEFIVEMEKKQNVVKFETIKDKPPSFPPTHIFSFSYFRSSRHGFPLYATARNAIRAVCIADELFERLREQNIDISIEFTERYGTEMYANKDRERLQFYFREPYTKISRTPALSRIEKQLHNCDWGSEKIEVPKNILCLNFGWSSYSSKSFKDSSLKLEEQIDVITNYIIQVLDGRIEDRKQRQIREQEAVRLDYIKKFNDGISQQRKQQLDIAIKESNDHESHLRLKSYLKTMKEIFSKLPDDEKKSGFDWISIVKEELNKIQPINTRIKKIKYASKKPKANYKATWYADFLPENYAPDFEAVYTEELKNYRD
jgi:hypothetical protein